MYCPKCRTEYQDGFTICAECNVPLTLECPPEPTPEYQEYVTVSVGSNVVRLAAAKAALDDAGIPSVTVGDSFRDLFALIGNPLAQTGRRSAQTAGRPGRNRGGTRG